MCVVIIKENLMVRLDSEIQNEILKKQGAFEMDFTKHPMKEFIFMEPIGVDINSDLMA